MWILFLRSIELGLNILSIGADNYILQGSKKDKIKQIGNAVACRFAYYLDKHIINNLL